MDTEERRTRIAELNRLLTLRMGLIDEAQKHPWRVWRNGKRLKLVTQMRRDWEQLFDDYFPDET